MKHIKKFNEGIDQDLESSLSNAQKALEELRPNLDEAIDLLDRQTASKVNNNVLQKVIEKTEEYKKFLTNLIFWSTTKIN